jgi:serine/threonine protein kinase
MTFTQALKRIEEASSATVLFPPGKDHAKRYKTYANLVHPDRVPDPLYCNRANEAFIKLNGFYHSLNRDGNHNSQPFYTGLVGKWSIQSALAKGDIGDLYLTGDPTHVLKIVRDEADNDLVAAEAGVLKHLYNPKRTYVKYLSRLVDSFQADDRQVNILEFANNYFSLDSLHKHSPRGINFRHIVWMMNRALSVLGYAHRKGVIHGAVLPEHLLYGGDDTVGVVGHGLKLVDWTCSASPTKPIPMIIKERESFYPPEVRQKKVGPGTDLFMLAKSLLSVAETPIPRRFNGFFEWCITGSLASRPQDAWELQDMWVKLAEQEYGRPHYEELRIAVQ